jgi:hypothetical protein
VEQENVESSNGSDTYNKKKNVERKIEKVYVG